MALSDDAESQEPIQYASAGGVVVRDGEVLILLRPSRKEARLPKGHIDPGETAREAAVREVFEESGYRVEPLADLGEQIVRFRYQGKQVVRSERYYLMSLTGERGRPQGPGEDEFDPAWMSWDDAQRQLTFEAERVWLRRAREAAAPDD